MGENEARSISERWAKTISDRANAALEKPLYLPRRLYPWVVTLTAEAMTHITTRRVSEREVLESHEQDVETRLKDMIDTHFSCGFVFEEHRWNAQDRLLARAFERWQYECGGVSFSQGWYQVVRPALTQVILSMPDDVVDGERVPWVRRYLRPEIEKALLGRTTDAKQEPAIDDAKEAQIQRRLDEIEAEEAAWDEAILAVREFMDGLTLDEQAILLAEYGDDAALATKQDVSLRTIGRWRAQLLQRLREYLR